MLNMKVCQIKTSTGRLLPLVVILKQVQENNIVVDKQLTSEWCKRCGMFGGGGCTPYAPDYDKSFRGKYKHYYILLFIYDLNVWLSEKQKQSKNVAFFALGYSEPIMTRLLQKVYRLFDKGKVLSVGFCNHCRPCVVRVNHEPCKKPKERMNSLESTGILVERLLINEKLGCLYWANHKEKYIPDKFKKVMLYMSNEPLDEDKFWCDFSKLVYTIE